MSTVQEIRERAIEIMEDWARDNSHGYDQIFRWGERGDYDCSAAVISAWEKAGVPVKTRGATYTGDMYDVFLSCGFENVTAMVNRVSGAGLLRADVLLNHKRHTAMFCGDGMEVEASINEMGTATGGQPGDQTGKEFLLRPYRNYPWDCVLRYAGNGGDEDGGEVESCTVTAPVLRRGQVSAAVAAMQGALSFLGYDIGPDRVDGDFGPNTDGAAAEFRRDNGLEPGVTCNEAMWQKILTY